MTGTLLSGGVPKNDYTIGGISLKKSDLKTGMIIETGYDEELYLVLGGKFVNSKLQGYELDDYDDNLVDQLFKPASISKVYDVVKIDVPFDMDIRKMLEEQKPQLLWERKPTKLSKKLISKMNKEQRERYIQGITYPVVIVD